MLSNAYFLAKFRFDTAENEPAKNLPILLTLTPNPFKKAETRPAERFGGEHGCPRDPGAAARGTRRD